MPRTDRPIVGRLAPAPTGALHVGNARTFLIAWLRCRAEGGRILLRVEDLDHPKVKPWAVQQIYDDLHWLGLDWDEGPPASDPLHAGAHGPYIQSERIERYARALAQLDAAGRIYPCVCTRREIEEAASAPHAGEETRYPGTCRDRFATMAGAAARAAAAGAQRAPAWRFRVGEGQTRYVDRFLGECAGRVADWSGDFVVGRGEGAAAYQLAVVVDDALMGVTEVVRGDDLAPSAQRQILLYEAFGLRPPAFFHVPLVVGPDGRRLAKRHGDTRIASLRAAGVDPARVVGWLGWTCGWAERGEALCARDLIERFRVETIPRAPVVLDETELRFLGAAALSA
jgi:glutamyl-tRNA synthetase